MRLATAFCAAGLLAALGLAAGPAGADPVKLRMGWVVAGADAPLLMFGQPGIARHDGKSYTLEAIHFAGTPPMITALAAGELDLAPLAYSSFALSVENARMDDLRVIADVFQDGVPGYYTNEDMVLRDGPIRTIADLKGKVLTTNGAGSAVDMALREMLRKHGLDDKRDVTIIESAFPNMKSELAAHKVDLIAGVRPFTADPQLRGMARSLFTQRDAIGRSQMIVLTARAAFLAKNKAAIVDFLEDSLRALAWYTAPAHHEAAVKRVSDYTRQPAALYAGWLFTKADYYHDPKGVPAVDALQANIDLQKHLGYLRDPLTVGKYLDLSLVQAAAARLE